MPVLTGFVHAHILKKPSRAGFAVIRLELIEQGAVTCVYQAKACSPTDQPVRIFKDGLGINMTMKNLLYFNISHHVRSIAWSGVSAEWCPQRRGHDSCQAARTAASCTLSRGGARCHGAALSASKFGRGAAMQSAATSMAGFLVNCTSAAV